MPSDTEGSPGERMEPLPKVVLPAIEPVPPRVEPTFETVTAPVPVPDALRLLLFTRSVPLLMVVPP